MTRKFLVFTLAAPMASFGDVAGHERRGSRERPGKSATLGLLGAALGIRRDDHDGQDALRTGYDIAVLVLNPGLAMQDFHTAQAVGADKKLRPRTRADALRRGKRNTILTRRDYRLDVHYRIAIEAQSSARWSLDDIDKALRRPQFTLYLGRKSCPLSLPLDPFIIEAGDILQALQIPDSRDRVQKRQAVRKSGVTESPMSSYASLSREGFKNLAQKPNAPPRYERINDDPIDRLAWHFTARQEVIVSNIDLNDLEDDTKAVQESGQ